ncbi:MAG TPA: site-specific integrase, partial [Myxococcales bacterium]|nr:site-specific integrase [Myxococcales bacterium]
MGFLYRRRDSRLWWVCWSDISGERRRESTGLADLEAARQVLEDLERRVAARRKLALAAVRTVADHARAQLEARARRGELQARDEAAALLEHLRGPLGSVPLCDVRHHHVLEWMRELAERRPLDSPPARALYMQLYRLFEEAVADGLLTTNPCRADRETAGALVADVDRRLSNHFTRAELERLISDGRVDRFRRCQWAVLSLTGARIGEVLCLRVRHLDLPRQPLGRLLVTGRWDSKQRRIAPPRSGLPREVPVHRTLAAILSEHVREVLPVRLGRAVDPDDLLFPAPGGAPQQAGTTLAHLQRDLEVVSLRKGNLHTLRRTFFALGRQDGAAPHILRLISEEGRPGDPDVPYAAKCAEIARLDVQRE